MRSKLLALTLFAFLGTGLIFANEETKNETSTEVKSEVTTENAEQSEQTEEGDDVQRVTTPLKVVNGNGGLKVIAKSQAVNVIMTEEILEFSEASVYDLNGRVIGNAVLQYPETEITVNTTSETYIVTVIKDGQSVYNSKIMMSR